MVDLGIPSWGIALGVIVIIVIAVGVYLRFFYTPSGGSTTNQTSSSQYTPNIGWGDAEPLDNSTCTTYQFPSTMRTTSYRCEGGSSTGNFVVAPTPSLETLDIATVIDFQNCVDSDQINAIRVRQYCNNVFDKTSTSTASWCFGVNGKYYTYGEYQDYFTYCNESSTLSDSTKELLCPGTIGGLSVGFQSQDFNYLPCMKYNGSIFVPVDQCNLTDPTQIFRIIRTSNLNSKPGPSSSPTGNDGPYIALIYRQTGQCVVPSSKYPSRAGVTLTLGDPNDWNGGFIWYLVPPLNYTIYWNGSCTACDNNGSSKGCNSFEQSVTSSQQLVYIGGTTQPDFPLNSKNTLQVLEFLQNTSDNYTYAMNNNGTSITLQEYLPYGNNCISDGTTNHPCNATNSAVNFATFQLYNTLAASCNWFNSGSGCS